MFLKIILPIILKYAIQILCGNSSVVMLFSFDEIGKIFGVVNKKNLGQPSLLSSGVLDGVTS